MFKMSERHPSMAIFLAKNWLDMSERTELTGAGGKPIEVNIDYKDKIIIAISRYATTRGEEQDDPET